MYTSGTSTDVDFVFEIIQAYDAEKDLEENVEEEPEILSPFISDLKLAANILNRFFLQKMLTGKYWILY